MSAVIRMAVSHWSEMKVTDSTESKGIQNVQFTPTAPTVAVISFLRNRHRARSSTEFKYSTNKTCHYPQIQLIIAARLELFPVTWYVIHTMQYIYWAERKNCEVEWMGIKSSMVATTARTRGYTRTQWFVNSWLIPIYPECLSPNGTPESFAWVHTRCTSLLLQCWPTCLCDTQQILPRVVRD